jgi:hypothetical protein
VIVIALKETLTMMKAGKYYVGDLCYVLDNRWNEFCSVTIPGNKVLDGEMQLPDGTKFATYCTAFGDGVYNDQFGNSYGVDAGLIGCVLVEDVDKETPVADLPHLGAVFDFPNDFATSETNGVITIGHVVIDTGYHDDDEEDYDGDDDDEDPAR